MNTMGVIQRGTNSVLVDLPAQQSVRKLEQAVRAGAPVRLAPKAQVEVAALTGVFQRGEPDEVVVRLAAGTVQDHWCSAYCDVSFELRQEEYMFTAVIQDIAEPQGAAVIRLSRPACLQIWQRRRFVRAAVADSAAVRLGPPGDFAHAQTQGMILNVSADGLACRVARECADAYAVDGRVAVAFTIGAATEEFRLNSTVISKTAGGTPGTMIVGLQFDQSPSAGRERERLIALLHAYH